MDQARLFELKMTILKMASDMLTNEYVDKKAENHNQWLIQNEMMWRTQGVRVPYPAFPPYPSQVEVLKKAEELWKCFVLDQSVRDEMKETSNVDNNNDTLTCVDLPPNAPTQSEKPGSETNVAQGMAVEEPECLVPYDTALSLPSLSQPLDVEQDYPVAVQHEQEESDVVLSEKIGNEARGSEPSTPTKGLAGFGSWLLRKTA